MTVREGESKENLESARGVDTVQCSVVGTSWQYGLGVYIGCGRCGTVQLWAPVGSMG
jgi:hypothetical protein